MPRTLKRPIVAAFAEDEVRALVAFLRWYSAVGNPVPTREQNSLMKNMVRRLGDLLGDSSEEVGAA